MYNGLSLIIGDSKLHSRFLFGEQRQTFCTNLTARRRNYSRVIVDLRSSQRLFFDLLATRLNHPVDDRGEAATGAPVPGSALLLQGCFTQHKVRLHCALPFHLD